MQSNLCTNISTSLNQWKNTNEVINWFSSLEINHLVISSRWTSRSYPSIIKEIFDDAIVFAKNTLSISEQEHIPLQEIVTIL